MIETVARPPAGSRARTSDLPPLLDGPAVATVVRGALAPLPFPGDGHPDLRSPSRRRGPTGPVQSDQARAGTGRLPTSSRPR